MIILSGEYEKVAPFSSQVDLSLEIPGRVIRLSSVGPTYFRTSVIEQIVATEGVLIVKIDDDVRRQNIRIQQSNEPQKEFTYSAPSQSKG